MASLQDEQKELEQYKVSVEKEQEILANQAAAAEKAKQLAQAQKSELEQLAKQKAEQQQTKRSSGAAKSSGGSSSSNGGSSSSAGSSPSVSAPDSSSTPSKTGSGLSYPVSAGITSGYGHRWGELHAGIDFGVPIGTPVRTAAPGVVIQTNTDGQPGMSGYGNVVLVSHYINGTSYTTLYAHLDSINVSQGQTVSAGQVIGSSGNTGQSTGPHLHFEVHRGGWNAAKSNSIDPLSMLN